MDNLYTGKFLSGIYHQFRHRKCIFILLPVNSETGRNFYAVGNTKARLYQQYVVYIVLNLCRYCIHRRSCQPDDGFTDPIQAQIPTPPERLVILDMKDEIPLEVDGYRFRRGIQCSTYRYQQSFRIFSSRTHANEDFDVAIIKNDFIPFFISNGLLKEISKPGIPEFQIYIS